MGIRSKIQTLYWFAVRPSFWRHALHLATRKFKANHDGAPVRAAARSWAEGQAVDEQQAYIMLGIVPPTADAMQSLERLLQEAEGLAQTSRVKMGGPGAIEFLFGCARSTRASQIVETGVAFGWSSLAFLAAILENRGGRLASVDMPYVKAGNERWVGVCVPERLRDNWKLIRKPDRNGLLEALSEFEGEVDVAHYDSDKSYWGRRWAYPILWRKLRPGGLFISDDIQDNFAFREFSEAVGVDPVVIRYQGKLVGALKKPG